jgi:hypothetical protein
VDPRVEKLEAVRESVGVLPALYLGFGRRIDQVGATDRLRPWSTKIEKTAKKSNGRRAFLFEKRESPNSCLGPFVKA